MHDNPTQCTHAQAQVCLFCNYRIIIFLILYLFFNNLCSRHLAMVPTMSQRLQQPRMTQPQTVTSILSTAWIHQQDLLESSAIWCLVSFRLATLSVLPWSPASVSPELDDDYSLASSTTSLSPNSDLDTFPSKQAEDENDDNFFSSPEVSPGAESG